MLNMVDAAFWPGAVDPDVLAVAGYLPSLASGGPYHAWSMDEWRAARSVMEGRPGGRLVPIYVPGPGEGPRAAASLAAAAAAARGFPHGTVIVLDREANRADLSPAWCQGWHDGLVAQGYVPMGYTSASTASVFAGWVLRWVARSGPAALLAGESAAQYEWNVAMGSGTVDRSVLSNTVPAWVVGAAPAPAPTRPTVTPPQSYPLEDPVFIASDGKANWLVGGGRKILIADPAELATLVRVVPALSAPIPLTLGNMPVASAA